MSFAQLVTATPTQRVGPCAVRAVIETLEPAEAAFCIELLARTMEDKPHTDVVQDFAKEGYQLSDSTIGRHRLLKCSCRLLAAS